MRLFETLRQIHEDCVKLCEMAVGRILPVAGNIGVFCQSEEEYEAFTKVREEMTERDENPNRKYFKLREPIVYGEVKYKWLYIRKFDSGPYGKFTGDVDFTMEPGEYAKYKQLVQEGKIQGAEMYDRAGWETWHITDPSCKAIAYVEMVDMAEKVRVKFD